MCRVLNFRQSSTSAAEDDGTLTLTIEKTGTTLLDARLSYSTVDGTATGASDFTLIKSTELVFGKDDTSKDVTVTVTDDVDDEPTESFAVEITADEHAKLGSTVRHSIQITDNDAIGVTLSSPVGATITEKGSTSGGRTSFTIELSRALTGDETLEVPLDFSGDASFGTDYTLVLDYTFAGVAVDPPTGVSFKNLKSTDLVNQPPTIVFTGVADASRRASLGIQSTDDSADELRESVSISLAPLDENSGTNLDGGAAGSGTVSFSIIDNDDLPVLSFDDSSVIEGANGATSTLRLAVNLKPRSGKEVSVDYAEISTGTATQGVDYTALTAGTLTFAAGETTQHIDITVVGDDVDEATNETVAVQLSSPVNATFTGGGVTLDGSATITDDDSTVVSLTRTGSGAIDEGQTAEFTVTLSRALAAGEIIEVPLDIGGAGVTTADWFIAKKSGMSLNTGVSLLSTNTSSPVVRFENAGAETATLVLGAKIDNTAEGGSANLETFEIALGTNTAFDVNTLGTNVGGGADPHASDAMNRFDVAVNDITETIVPKLKVSAPTVTEGEPGAIELDLSYSVSETISIDIAAVQLCPDTVACPQGTSAASIADDLSLASQSVAFAPGEQTKTISFTVTDDSSVESTEVFMFRISDLDSTEAVIDSATQQDGTVSGDPYWFVRIQDNDNPNHPNVTIASVASPITEAMSAAFTVTAIPTPSARLTVNLTVSETGKYVANAETGSMQVIIPASGDSAGTATFNISTVADALDEPDGAVIATLDSATGYTVGAASSAKVVVKDDDATTVTLARTGVGGIDEDGGTVGVTVTLGRELTAGESVTVPLAVSGATVTTHYTYVLETGSTGVTLDTQNPHSAQNPAVVFSGAGARTATLTFTAVDNDDVVDRTLNVKYGTSPREPTPTGLSGGISPSGSVSVKIVDDDMGVSVTGAVAAEGDPVVFTITLPQVPTLSDAIVFYTTSHGRENAADAPYQRATGTDYEAVRRASITIKKGSRSGTVSIATKDDDTYEGDHYFQLTLDSTNFGRLSANPIAIGTITDADDAPGFAFSASSTTIAEDGGSVTLTVGKTGTTLLDSTVSYATVDGTATGGSGDFTAIESTDLVFAKDDTSKSITISIADDTTDEPVESFTVDLTAGAHAQLGSPSSHSIVISDNDMTEVKLARDGSGGIPEAGGTAEISVTLERPLIAEERVSIPLVVSGATATSHYTLGLMNDDDTDVTLDTSAPHSAQNPAVVFAGEGAQAAELMLTAVDNEDQIDRTVKFAYGTMGVSSGYSPIGSASVPIIDNDAAIAVTDARAEEGSAVTFTVTLPKSAPAGGVSVVYSTSDGRGESTDESYQVATSADYTAASEATLDIAEGLSSDSVTIATANDDVYEGDHHFTLTLESTSHFIISESEGAATGTIGDSDDAPKFDFSAASTAADESDGTVTLTVDKTGTTLVDATVSYASVDGTAAGGSDFTQIASTDLVFAKDDTSKDITVSLTDDTTDELTETFTVGITAGAHAQLGSTTSHSIAITDNDATQVTLQAPSGDIVEAGGTKTLTISLGRMLISDESVAVPLSFKGVAQFGSDYTIGAPDPVPTGVSYSNLTSSDHTASPPTVTFTGVESAALSATLILTATADLVDEGASETVIVTLGTLDSTSGSNLDGGASGSGTASFAITENTALPVLSVNTPSVTEGASGETATLRFTVTLTLASSRSVTIDYADLSGGTASAGADYSALSSGTLTFAIGETEKHIDITVLGDGLDEPDETVTLEFSKPVGATLTGGGTTLDGTGTITDDDDAPTVSIDDALAIAEGDDPMATTNLAFTLMLSNTSGRDITVPYELSGSASAGSDYESPNQLSVSIAAEQSTATLNIPVKGDAVDEPDETVVVTLGVPTNAAVSTAQGAGTGTGMITDNDPTTVVLAGAPGNLIEGSSKNLTVTLNRGLIDGESLAVPLTFGGTATRGEDYTLSGKAAQGVGYTNLTTGAVTITFTGAGSGETSNLATLTLQTSNDQVVETTAETLQIGFANINAVGLNGGVEETDNIADFIIEDSDAAILITESDSSTIVGEDGTDDSYDVVLNSKPTHDVTVTISTGAGVRVSTAGSSTPGPAKTLTFSPINWSVKQKVTVHAVDDRVDNNSFRRVEIQHSVTSSDSQYSSLNPVKILVTVVDDDPTEVSISRILPDGAINEGAQAGLEVQLSRELIVGERVLVPLKVSGQGISASDYQFSLSQQSTDGISLSIAAPYSEAEPALVFAGDNVFSNIGERAVVTVAAVDDEVDEGSSEELTVTLGTISTNLDRSGGYGSSGAVIPQSKGSSRIEIVDDDEAGVTVSESSVTIHSGDEVNYTLRLTSQPAQRVVIRATSSNPHVVNILGNISGSRYVAFDQDNWQTPQTITLTGIDAGTTTVTHVIMHANDSRYGKDLSIGSVAATVPAKPVLNLSINREQRLEGQLDRSLGSKPLKSADFGFFLTGAPHPVRVPTSNLLSVSGVNASGYRLELPSYISFPAGDKYISYPIYILADDVDEKNKTMTIGFGSGFPAKLDKGTEVTIKVIDQNPTAVTLSLLEEGENVIPQLTEGEKTTVAVTLGRDLDVDEMVTVPLMVSGTNVTASDYSITLNTADSSSGVSLDAAAPYSAAQPAVVFAGADNAEVIKATLDLHVLDDEDSAEPTELLELGMGTLSSNLDRETGTGASGTIEKSGTIVFMLKEPDPVGPGSSSVCARAAPCVNVGPIEMSVKENGAPGRYFIWLNTDPDQAVTVDITSGDAARVRVEPAQLTFTSGGDTVWSKTQEVRVTALPDADIDGNNVIITHAVSGYTGVSSVRNVTVSLRDAGHGVIASTRALKVSEGGTAEYRLRLKSRPAAAVTLTPQVTDSGAVLRAGAAVTFQPNEWNTEKAIEVSGLSPGRATVIHEVSSTDTDYGGTRVALIGVTVEAAPARISGADFTVAPVSARVVGGEAVAFTVRAANALGGAVAVEVVLGDVGGAVAAGQFLTRRIVVPAGGSADFSVNTETFGQDRPDGAVTATLAARYGGASARVAVVDNIATEVSLTPGTDLSLREQTPGDTAQVTVTLGRDLAAGEVVDVPLAFASNDGVALPGAAQPHVAAVSVSGTGVTLHDANTVTPKVRFTGGADTERSARVQIAATANRDNNLTNDTFTIGFGDLADTALATTVSGGLTTAGRSPSVRLTVVDNQDAFEVSLTGGSDLSVVEQLTSDTALVAVTLERDLAAGEIVVVPLAFASTTGVALPGAVQPHIAVVSATGTGVSLHDATTAVPKVRFNGGAGTEQVATVQIAATSRDDGDQTDDVFTVGLGDLADATLATSLSEVVTTAAGSNLATLTLFDDDNPFTVALTGGADVSMLEQSSTDSVTLTVTLERDLEAGEIVEVPLAFSTSAGLSLPGQSQAHIEVRSASGTGVTLHDAGTTSPKVRFTGGAGTEQVAGVLIGATGRDDGNTTDDDFAVALGNLSDSNLATQLTGAVAASGVSNSVVLTLLDNDAFVAVSDASAAEGEVLGFAVTLPNPAPEGGVTVGYAVSDGTGGPAYSRATAPDDFRGPRGGTVTIAQGQSSGTISVPTVDDNVYESDHRLEVRLTSTTHGRMHSTHYRATGTIDDAADKPEFGFLSAQHRVTEGEAILVSVAQGGSTTSLVPATLSYAAAGDGDTAGAGDYDGASGTLTFEPGGATRQRFTVRAVADGVNDIGEHFTLVLTAGGHAKVGTVYKTKVGIADADPVTVGVEAPDKVREGETVVFTLGSDAAVDNDLKLKVEVTQSGTYVTQTAIREYEVVLRGGTRSVSLSIGTSDIETHETDGSVRATLLPGDGYDIDTGRVLATVVIDGTEPSVGISAAAARVVEGNDAEFTVRADFAPVRDLGISLMIGQQGDYAAAGQTGTKQVTLGAGQTEATYAVETHDDNTPEDPGAIQVSLKGGAGYTISAEDAAATMPVVDNDGSPLAITLETDTQTVAENGGPKTVRVTAAIDGAGTFDSDQQLKVTVGNAQDSAAKGTDYTNVSDKFFTISAGAASGFVDFTLQPHDDVLNEGAESISIKGELGGVTFTDAVITIQDDDEAPSAIALAVDADTAASGVQSGISEDSGARTVRVTATITGRTRFDSDQQVNVEIGQAADSATETTDYADVADQTITIKAGAASGFVEFTLTPTDDALNEATETISVKGTLTGVTFADAGISLIDDETPAVSIEAAKTKVTEGQVATFTVRLLEAALAPVTVSYEVTGTGGYVTDTSGTVVVQPGGSAQIQVQTHKVAGDTPDGELTVAPADGTGYMVTDESASTIEVEDTEATMVSVRGSGSMIEGNAAKTGELTVTLSRALVEGEKVTVPLRFATRARDFLSGPLNRRDVVVHAAGADIAALDSDTHELGLGVRLFGPSSSKLAGQRTPPNSANYAVEFKGGAGTPRTATLKLTARAERSPNDKADAKVTVSFRSLGSAALSNVGGGIVADSGHNSALFIVVDRDRSAPAAMTLTVDADTAANGVQGSVAEDGGAKMVRVTATIDGAKQFTTDQSVTVSVGNSGDSATEGTDYADIADQTIPITAGRTSGHVEFTLMPTDDALDEPPETISFKGMLTGVTFADTGITITDDDPTTVTLAGAAGDLTEGSGKDLTVTLGRGLVAGESLEVPLSFSGTATRGTDYTLTGTAARGVAYADLNSGETATVTFTGALGGATATVAAITLTAAVDSVVESTAETVDIGLGTPAASGLDGGTSETDSLAGFGIVDPDKVSVSTASLALTELHATDAERTYTLVLGTDPGADVEVTVASADTTAVLVDADANAAGDQGSLTFTHGGSGTWDDPQTVTVRAVNDADAMGETVTVSHDATVSTDSGNPYHGISIGDVSVTVTDAGHGVTVSESALSVYTNNDTAEYTIVLNSAPGGTVTVTPTSSDTAKAQVGSPVRFNDSNWRNPQMVTVTGRGAGSATISHAVTGATTAYPAAMDIAPVAVTVGAAGDVAVTLSAPPGDLAEDGSAKVATVELSRALGDGESIRVPVEFGGDADHGVDYAVSAFVAQGGTANGVTFANLASGEASVTFAGGAGNAQSASFLIETVADEVDEGVSETVTVELGDPIEGATGSGSVSFAITDDDTAGVEVGVASASVEVGGQTEYTLRLTSRPLGTVAVTPTSADEEVVEIASIAGTRAKWAVFDADNWSEAQTVALSGDAAGGPVNVSHAVTYAAGGGYGTDLSIDPVAVTVTAAVAGRAGAEPFGVRRYDCRRRIDRT